MTNPDEPTRPIAGGPSAPEPTRALPRQQDGWDAGVPDDGEPYSALPAHQDGWGVPPSGSPEPTRALPPDGDPWLAEPSADPVWPEPSADPAWPQLSGEAPAYQPRYGAAPAGTTAPYDPYDQTQAPQPPAGRPYPQQPYPQQPYLQQPYPQQPYAPQPPAAPPYLQQPAAGQPSAAGQPYAPQPYGSQPWAGQQPSPWAPQQYGYQPPSWEVPPSYPGQPPGQPPYDPTLPWWHPAHQPVQPPSDYQPAPPPRRRTTLQRVSVVLSVALALSLALGGLSYLFPRTTERAGEPVQTLPPSQPQAAPSQDDAADRPRAQAARGVTAAESAGVVLIEAGTTGGLASGTGMVVTSDGKVLTNYHVVAGSDSIDATLADTGRSYDATMLGFDQSRDIALLQLQDAGGLVTVTLDDDPVRIGDPAYAVGNADGGGALVRAAGRVTDLNENLTVTSDSPWGSEENLEGLIETSAGAVPGHSGGPMFDAEAEVMGITTAGSVERGSSYAIPIAEAMSVVEIIQAGQDAGTVRVGPAGYLGVKIGETNRLGATVTEVVADSPAEAAGIQAGAILTRIGDSRITADTDLAGVVRSLEPGQQVQVEWVAANGTRDEATVTLGASPVN
ncbi:MAG: trypsin-like peptidase domain-containing protein [Propionicimonas sp.]|nr:trypsin-like peptidase domain-containing protein [Propionicimonas sp.]